MVSGPNRQKPERRPNRMGNNGASVRPDRVRRDTPRAEVARPQGAVQSQMSWSDKFGAWYAHHTDSAIESLLRMLGTPLQSLMTWLVIAIAVALPAALFVVFNNIQQIGHIQFADCPGRHEPDTGDIAFAEVFDWLKHSDYAGYVAAEYRPSKDSANSFAWKNKYFAEYQ